MAAPTIERQTETAVVRAARQPNLENQESAITTVVRHETAPTVDIARISGRGKGIVAPLLRLLRGSKSANKKGSSEETPLTYDPIEKDLKPVDLTKPFGSIESSPFSEAQANAIRIMDDIEAILHDSALDPDTKVAQVGILLTPLKRHILAIDQERQQGFRTTSNSRSMYEALKLIVNKSPSGFKDNMRLEEWPEFAPNQNGKKAATTQPRRLRT